MTETEPLLVADGLHVRYGVARALSGVSLEVPVGSSLAVVGANGAGKSSLARALSGLVPPAAGSVRFAGQDITGLGPERVRRLGLSYLPEGRGVFPSLSVSDNLRMAVRWIDNKAERLSGIDRVIDLFPVLGQRLNQAAGTLSGGEQQMLSLARGLAVWPKLLIADEMSLGLAPLMVDVMFEHLEVARKSGMSVILIEQFVGRALSFADDVIILAKGSLVWSGPAGSISQHEILDRYMGQQEDHQTMGHINERRSLLS